jgi:hypothetical protein
MFIYGINSPRDQGLKNPDDQNKTSMLLEGGRFFYFTTNDNLSAAEALPKAWTDNLQIPYRDTKRRAHYWFRFKIENTDKNQKDMVIYHNADFTSDDMNFYHLREDSIGTVDSAARQRLELKQPLDHQKPGIQIKLEPGETAEFLVHAKTSRILKPNFVLTTSAHFKKDAHKTFFILGTSAVIQIIGLLLASIIAYRYRDRAAIWHVGLAAVMLLNIMNSLGLIQFIAHASTSSINLDVMMKFTQPATLFFFLNLISSSLNTNVNTPKLNQWIQATILSSLTLAVLSIEPAIGKFVLDGEDRLAFIGMLLAVLASLACFRRQVPEAGYFTMASFVVIDSNFPSVGHFFDADPFSTVSQYSSVIGQSTLNVLVSLGLLAKHRRLSSDQRVKQSAHQSSLQSADALSVSANLIAISNAKHPPGEILPKTAA